MTDQKNAETRTLTGAGSPVSQQVSWWDTHVFLGALIGQANNLPPAGTPAWRSLPDSDPRKLLSLALAGEHHVLRMETAQAAMAEASRELSAAADWSALAQRIRNRSSSAYIPRRRSA